MFVSNGLCPVLQSNAVNHGVYEVIQFWINLHNTVNWYLQVMDVGRNAM